MSGDDLVTLVDGLYNKLKNDIQCSETAISSKIENLTAVLEQAHSKITDLENKNRQLSAQVKNLSRESKKNNILIFGIEESEGEDIYNIIISFFINTLLVPTSKSEINHAYRFGKASQNIRPIMVKLVNFHKKIDLLKNGYTLKGSSVSISSDLLKEDREIQKILRKHQKQARDQQLNATIRNNKLVVNEVAYTVDDLKSLEEESDSSITERSILAGEEKINDNSKQTHIETQTPERIQLTPQNGKRTHDSKHHYIGNIKAKEVTTVPSKAPFKRRSGTNYGLRSVVKNAKSTNGASTSGKFK